MSTSCPSNDFPELGATWGLRILEPDDLGFFTVATTADGKTIYTGTGPVTSASYSNNSRYIPDAGGAAGRGA